MTYQLYQGDCLQFMRTLDAGSVDAVITDPPYGIDYVLDWQRQNGFNRFSEMKQDFDPSPFLDFRTVLLFGANYYSSKLPNGGWLCWDKRLSESADRMFGSSIELAWYKTGVTTSRVKMFRVLHGGLINSDGGERLHPTQKPVKLMSKIILDFTNHGDTIFDPFMGSGTTGVACMQLGRNFIGCEIDPGYFKIAEKRISEAAAQPALFTLDAPKIEATQAAFV